MSLAPRWILLCAAIAATGIGATRRLPASRVPQDAVPQVPVLYRNFKTSAWPEADKLFRSDPRWLGGDAAYSVDLGHGRVPWLFGDSFIADAPGQTRRQSSFRTQQHRDREWLQSCAGYTQVLLADAEKTHGVR